MRVGFIFSKEAVAISRISSATLAKLRSHLRARLEPRRFCHVMGVETMALLLAEKAGIPREKVCAAALLHDMCKEIKDGELAEVLRGARRFRPSDEDWHHPNIWHGIAAAESAPELFGLEDVEVLEAVAWHTTGNAPMGRVGLLLYVADYIEPTRNFAGVEALRRELMELPLVQAARSTANRKIEQISRKGKAIHSRTRRMAEWLGNAPNHQGANPFQ